MLPLNRDHMAARSCILIIRWPCKDSGRNSDAGQPLSHRPCDSLRQCAALQKSHPLFPLFSLVTFKTVLQTLKRKGRRNPDTYQDFCFESRVFPAGTAGQAQPLSVPGCNCWGAWGTVLVPGTQRFVDSTIKCYGILICSLLIFHFLNFWHSYAVLLKRLPGVMNIFLELKVWLAKHFPSISS